MVWRTVEAAASDLQQIAEDGIVNFGEHRARAYVAQLIETFEPWPHIRTWRPNVRHPKAWSG
jgi:plasmid stabilization system protein ParE